MLRVLYSKTGNIHSKTDNIYSKSWNITFVEVLIYIKARYCSGQLTRYICSVARVKAV